MTTENENEDPFKDFIQEEFNDGKPVTAAAEEGDDETADDKTTDDKTTDEAEVEVEAVEGADEEVDEAEEGEEEEKPAPAKKKVTAKERIAELTRIRREQERELEEFRTGKRQPTAAPATRIAKLDDVPKELQDDVKKAQEDAVKALGAAPKPPNAKDFEFGTIDEKYLDARDAYNREVDAYNTRKADAESKVLADLNESIATAESNTAKMNAKVDEGKKLFDDFEEVVIKGAEANAYPISESVAILAINSEVGAQVVYHLAKNPDVAKEIHALPVIQQAARFGALEAKFLAETRASSGSKQDPATKKPGAPAPIEQPRGSGGKHVSSIEEVAGGEDFAAFERAAAAQARKRTG